MGTLNLSSGVALSASGTAFGNSAASWSDAPPGTIIQTVNATTSTELSTSSSDYQTWISKEWTPRSSTSHKIITVFAIRLIVAPSMEANIRINDGTTETDRWRLYNDTSGNFWYNPVLSWYWPQTHTAGTPITFNAQCRDGNGQSTNVTWGDNGSTSTMVIQEIAQ